MNVQPLASLHLGHLCSSIVPRFIDDDRDLLGGALRNLDLCYCAAANLRGWAAKKSLLEFDGFTMRPAAESVEVVAAWILRGHEVVPEV